MIGLLLMTWFMASIQVDLVRIVKEKAVVADSQVWEAYLMSPKNAPPFRTRSLWYFGDFTMIYAKDRANGKDAEEYNDAIEEIREQLMGLLVPLKMIQLQWKMMEVMVG